MTQSVLPTGPHLLLTALASHTRGHSERNAQVLPPALLPPTTNVLRTFNAVGELDDRGRTLTVFAPTNEAIRQLGRCFGVPPISIQVVLTVARRYATVDFHREVERTALYHVTEGRRSWGDLLRTVGYPSLLVDHWMSTSANRAGLVGRTPNFPVATVLNREAPIQAENGLLYKVNLPLLPYDVPSGQIQC